MSHTPAKINLYLQVTGRRPDGYHELETLFYPLHGLHDDVTLTRHDGQSGITMFAGNAALPCNDSNLCVRAVRAVCHHLEIPADGWHISLQKNIPIAAGLGGGSSDAAAVLRQMQKELPLTDDILAEIALTLGADVPYFLDPRPALATGIGEKLVPVNHLPARLPLLLAAPQFPVSAKWAYQHLEKISQQSSGAADLITALRTGDLALAGALLRNDLAPAVEKKFPCLAMIRQEFERLGACGVLMSGSGPTMFGLFTSPEERDRAAEMFARHLPVKLFLS